MFATASTHEATTGRPLLDASSRQRSAGQDIVEEDRRRARSGKRQDPKVQFPIVITEQRERHRYIHAVGHEAHRHVADGTVRSSACVLMIVMTDLLPYPSPMPTMYSVPTNKPVDGSWSVSSRMLRTVIPANVPDASRSAPTAVPRCRLQREVMRPTHDHAVFVRTTRSTSQFSTWSSASTWSIDLR